MTLSAVTLTECGSACLQQSQCVSFDWNQATGECHLLQESNFYPICGCQFVPDPNWVHYDYVEGTSGSRP